VGYARVAKVGGGLIDVSQLFGRTHVWSLTLGLRMAAGMTMHRMGRYGAAGEDEHAAMMEHHGMTQ
jgi:hypothetical protein